MKILIITVGTRQVGWKCQDGIIRSLGADGDRGHPPHIDQIYAEFKQERGYHGELPKNEHRWAARHLGELIYQHCQSTNDFSRVVLPMDAVILQEQVKQDLSHVILWGTNQPASIAWNFRRGDTLWLAQLMAGKVRQDYPHLTVEVWNPEVAVNQVDQIQKELRAFIAQYALHQLTADDSEPLTLQIQTKGSAPQIASSLEICTAALMRQYTVEQVIPVEPSPLFLPTEPQSKLSQARMAENFKTVNLGYYFWPVERERILSAWKRGDFAEAKIWLAAHRDQHQALYELAHHLALASNWQWKDTLKALQGISWIDSPATKRKASKNLRKQWRLAIQDQYKENETPDSKFLKIWESRLFIYLQTCRMNYTAAFMQTVQAIERLLFWRYQTEDWIEQGYLIPYEGERAKRGKNYPASFGELIRAWRASEGGASHFRRNSQMGGTA